MLPNIYDLHICIDDMASVAVRASATNDAQGPRPEFVANDLLRLRLHLYRRVNNVLVPTTLDAGSDFYVAGAKKTDGTVLFTQDTFTLEANTSAAAADDGELTFTAAVTDGTTILLTDAAGQSITFEAVSSGSPAAGHTAFTAGVSASADMAAFVTAVNASALAITATNAGSGVGTLAQDLPGEEGNTTIVVSGAGVTLGSSFTNGADAESYYEGDLDLATEELGDAIATAETLGIVLQVQASDAIGGAATKRRTIARLEAEVFRDDANDDATPTITPTPHYLRLLTVEPTVDSSGNGPGNPGEFYCDGVNLWICFATNQWRSVPVSATFPPP